MLFLNIFLKKSHRTSKKLFLKRFQKKAIYKLNKLNKQIYLKDKNNKILKLKKSSSFFLQEGLV